MGIKQAKGQGKFSVNNPKGASSGVTRVDITNPFPGRKDSDVTPNSSGLRGRESIAMYAKGRSGGK